MTTNLHAHVSTAARDCDGPIYREWVETLNDAERKMHEDSFNEAGESINDFHDYAFRERLLSAHVSFHPEFVVRVEIQEAGFTMSEETEEGFRSAEVEWCEDPKCDLLAKSQRDVYAEQMGY